MSVATTPIGQTPSTQLTDTAALTNRDGLGREAFLQLLVTQLQHQDPMEPQKDGGSSRNSRSSALSSS